jgi:branched-chain amino acid transport system substrate-binding protein
VPRIYLSAPLHGSAARLARDLLRGAELALEAARAAAVELVVLDSSGPGDATQALANARRAADDAQALAYVGDFHSAHVHVTAPVLAAAGLLQVAPVATWVGLGGPTLVRLSPHDGVGAASIAGWLAERDVDEALVVHDRDDGYGRPVAALCVAAAEARGIRVRARPVWERGERPADDVGGARAVLYVGVAGSGAVELWHDLHAIDPRLWLHGSEGLAQPWFVRALSLEAAERTRLWVAQRASFAPYGYESVALVLDALAAGAADRASVLRAVRGTRDRDSVIGRYSLDEHGHTTTAAHGRVRPLNGEIVWDVE